MKVFFTILSFLSPLLVQTARADAAYLPVCERTSAVAEFIVSQINTTRGTRITCADVTREDLLDFTRIAVSGAGIHEFKVLDFSGLPNLEILNIRSNPYKTLPEGLFSGLDNLETLVIIATELRYLPDDFLADTPKLKNLHAFRNKFRTISLSVLERFAASDLEVIDLDDELLQAEKDRLREIFDGGFGVLSFY
jgi:Leucine-rich repeat (LRR) protein